MLSRLKIKTFTEPEHLKQRKNEKKSKFSKPHYIWNILIHKKNIKALELTEFWYVELHTELNFTQNFNASEILNVLQISEVFLVLMRGSTIKPSTKY